MRKDFPIVIAALAVGAVSLMSAAQASPMATRSAMIADSFVHTVAARHKAKHRPTPLPPPQLTNFSSSSGGVGVVHPPRK
jgi:hypothetical protein